MPPDPPGQAPGIERFIREVNGALLSKAIPNSVSVPSDLDYLSGSFVPDRFLLFLILALLPPEIVPTLIPAGPLDG
jgi:hypothetical protein